jgi:hypothetical protein
MSAEGRPAARELLLGRLEEFDAALIRRNDAVRRHVDGESVRAETDVRESLNNMRPHIVAIAPDVRDARENLMFFDDLAKNCFHNVAVIRVLIERLVGSTGGSPASQIPDRIAGTGRGNSTMQTPEGLGTETEDATCGQVQTRTTPAAGDKGNLPPTPAPVEVSPESALTVGKDDTDSHILRWQDIELRFTSEHRVQIFVGGRPGVSLNFAELGFEDRRGRGGKPIRAWGLLLDLACNDGIYPASRVSGDQSIQKRAQELRNRLVGHFQIAEDPLPFLEGTGYKSRLKIGRSPSFDT